MPRRHRITANRLLELKKKHNFFDGYCAYRTIDEKPVQEIVEDCAKFGVRLWFAPWQIIPGEDLHPQITAALQRIPKGVLFFGQQSQRRHGYFLAEVDHYVDAASKEEASFLPVILPGADSQALPPLAKSKVWVEIENVDGMHRLICGILGCAPGSQARLTARDVWNWQRAQFPFLDVDH